MKKIGAIHSVLNLGAKGKVVNIDVSKNFRPRKVNIITPISLTAGTAGTIPGTATCLFVDVYYSSDGVTWIEFQTGVPVTAGAWTATGTIADADTYDFKAVDSVNTSVYDQVDNVVVESGEYLFQIVSTECDFTPYDSIAIGTKLAIYGKVAGASTIPQLGGKALVANATMALVLFDPGNSTVAWAYSVNTSGDDASYYTKLKADSTHIYFATNSNGTASKLDLYKVATSNGAGTVQNLSNTGGTSGNKMCQVELDSTNVYVAHIRDAYKIDVYKRLKSNLSAVTSATIKTFTGSEFVNTGFKLDTSIDETYLYYAFTYYDGSKYQHQIAKTALDLTGYAEIRKDYGYDGATPANTYGYGIEKIGSAIIANNRDVTPNLYWVGDGSTEAEVSALMVLMKQSNGQLFLHGVTTTKRINTTTYATTWTKDYTSDAVATCCKVENVGSNYYLVGSTTGDFDGDNPTNTKSCAIIGKINIANGDL